MDQELQDMIALGLTFHKLASSSTTKYINGAMKKIPQWRQFVPRRGEVDSGILPIKESRKEYLNFYRAKLGSLVGMSKKEVKSKANHEYE